MEDNRFPRDTQRVRSRLPPCLPAMDTEASTSRCRSSALRSLPSSSASECRDASIGFPMYSGRALDSWRGDTSTSVTTTRICPGARCVARLALFLTLTLARAVGPSIGNFDAHLNRSSSRTTPLLGPPCVNPCPEFQEIIRGDAPTPDQRRRPLGCVFRSRARTVLAWEAVAAVPSRWASAQARPKKWRLNRFNAFVGSNRSTRQDFVGQCAGLRFGRLAVNALEAPIR